ncbi:MAG: DUF4249 domain-containing protein [Flavobacteriales bacterium]|nr:DUF4249 domain-containing protein [Flavobacteriales bacterium]
MRRVLARSPLLIAGIGAVLLQACEKEITVDLPITEPRVVVEGTIETGQPPIILLTRTQSYFAATSISSIAESFIREASVTIDDGQTLHTLIRICSSMIPDSLLDEAAAATGIDAQLLANADICIWTKPDLLGEEGRTYRLRVEADGKTMTSVTTIPHSVALDSLWFRLALQRPNDDTLGFLWARLTDPDTIGNGYRWLAKRLGKDNSFVPPFFSVFEDRYVNGLTFDFNFNRGSLPFSTAEDDENEERGFFKTGDTVAVKFVSIGQDEFRFYNSFQNNVATQGDVFSNPANAVGNIEGGLGIWAGWGVRLDTVVCVP